jgi:hypothetical protein
LLDVIPKAGELTLAKLAKDGFAMTDTCPTAQKIQRLVADAVQEIAEEQGLSPDEIKLRESFCWQHLYPKCPPNILHRGLKVKIFDNTSARY